MIVTKACSAVKYNFLIISVFQGIIIMGMLWPSRALALKFRRLLFVDPISEIHR